MEDYVSIQGKPESDLAFQERLRRLMEMKEFVSWAEYSEREASLGTETYSANHIGNCGSCGSCGGGGGSCRVTGVNEESADDMDQEFRNMYTL